MCQSYFMLMSVIVENRKELLRILYAYNIFILTSDIPIFVGFYFLTFT